VDRRDLSVKNIARNSTFTYKGRPAKVQQIASELGASYVSEGSDRARGRDRRYLRQARDVVEREAALRGLGEEPGASTTSTPPTLAKTAPSTRMSHGLP